MGEGYGGRLGSRLWVTVKVMGEGYGQGYGLLSRLWKGLEKNKLD